MLQKRPRAVFAPEREPIKDEIGIDEFLVGGVEEEGLTGGRQRGKKVSLGAAVEVHGHGLGPLRLGVLSDASGDPLGAFAQATTAAGAMVHADGWSRYNALGALGYDHRARSQRAVPVGRAAAAARTRAVWNINAWMHGTHPDVSPERLPV